jgi:hypothetical protein
LASPAIADTKCAKEHTEKGGRKLDFPACGVPRHTAFDGGGSVLTMMTTPLAHGLFHKAIIESGGGRTGIGPMRRVRESAPNLPSGEAVGIAFAEKAGIQGEDATALAALRQLPAERIVDGLNMASMMNPTYAGPMIDGKIVAETPEQALVAGHAMKVPVIAGANSSDIGFSFAKSMDELFAPFGANREKAEAAYNPEKSGEFRKIGMLVASDRMMVEPARFVVRTVAATGQRAYEYRFSYVAESLRKQWKGAPHATEIPFVFDTHTSELWEFRCWAVASSRPRTVRVHPRWPSSTGPLRGSFSQTEMRWGRWYVAAETPSLGVQWWAWWPTTSTSLTPRRPNRKCSPHFCKPAAGSLCKFRQPACLPKASEP